MLRYSALLILAPWFSPGVALLSAPALPVKSLGDAVRACEERRFAEAAAYLRGLSIPRLADYISYYRGVAFFGTGQYSEAVKEFAAAARHQPASPLAGKAVVGQAQALTASGQATDAIALLQERYAALPQPDADLALGTAFQTAGEGARAVEFFQRVHYFYPAGEPAMKAAAALLSLEASLGSAFPPAPGQHAMERLEKLIALGEYIKAQSEAEELAARYAGAVRDTALVRVGASLFSRGRTAEAYRHLKGLEVDDRDAEAERLYYLAECARKAGDDEEMLDHIRQLGKKHEYSRWRLKALISAGNRFLLTNNTERYKRLYQDAADAFPETSQGAYAHWKVAWLSYLERKRDASERMRAQLERFSSYNASAALYFLGRLAERQDRWNEARAYYGKLVERFPGYYYGVMGRERLRQARIAAADASAKVMQYLDGLPLFAERKEAPSLEPHAATKVRLERARLLQSADLEALADSELRFAARLDAQPIFLAIERARMKPTVHEALRAMKGLAPSYLSMELSDAPAEFWRRLFPLPFQQPLVSHANKHDLDPFVVAALIRQESEFNPRARSRANALGLTQVMPATGRSLARHVGLRRYSTNLLYQAEPNLRIGTYYLRSMLDQWAGKWEPTLASYNAGKSRASNWSTWGNFEEPAEFVETIPFTETREYVQAVIRNAALYRQIYSSGLPKAPEPVTVAKAPVKKSSTPARVSKAPVKKKTTTAAKKTTAKKRPTASAKKRTTTRQEAARARNRRPPGS